MPYRLDLANPSARAFDTLVDLGALDVETTPGGLAALMPDSVSAAEAATALHVGEVSVTAAPGRDDDSVWTLSPRQVRVGSLLIVRDAMTGGPDALQIADGAAFGTGLHATTALCLEALEDLLSGEEITSLLDVGTGTGILALAALRLGVERAVGLDLDPAALQAAAANARANGLAARFLLLCGGPDAVRGSWPLIVANIRAGELIEMAPALVRHVASRGRVLLSGIPQSAAAEVARVYQRLGMISVGASERDGWAALVLRATW